MVVDCRLNVVRGQTPGLLPVPDHTALSRRGPGLPIYDQGRIGADEPHLIVDSTGLKSRRRGRLLRSPVRSLAMAIILVFELLPLARAPAGKIQSPPTSAFRFSHALNAATLRAVIGALMPVFGRDVSFRPIRGITERPRTRPCAGNQIEARSGST